MSKKAFVFDTNFIIQNRELDEALDKIKEQFSIYITQVSIDERIAQQCRELRASFDEAEQSKYKFIHFATIEFKKTYEEESEFYKTGIQAKYEGYFGENIIPFKKDGETLSAIIDRANKRLPPFSAAKDASDKGFKDCLMWLSILEFFKNYGENEIILVTDDKSAFGNHKDALTYEFNKETGKSIEIHPNSYYKDLLKQIQANEPQEEGGSISETQELPNMDSLRGEIEDALEGIRGVEYENYFGNPQWAKTFTTSIPFDATYMRTFFAGLRSDISSHIFETSLPPSKILDFDGRITDEGAEIPIKNLENALFIYQCILSNYPQYIEQFFEASAKILNRNYIAPKAFIDIKDDDLPF